MAVVSVVVLSVVVLSVVVLSVVVLSVAIVSVAVVDPMVGSYSSFSVQEMIVKLKRRVRIINIYST